MPSYAASIKEYCEFKILVLISDDLYFMIFSSLELSSNMQEERLTAKTFEETKREVYTTHSRDAMIEGVAEVAMAAVQMISMCYCSYIICDMQARS